ILTHGNKQLIAILAQRTYHRWRGNTLGNQVRMLGIGRFGIIPTLPRSNLGLGLLPGTLLLGLLLCNTPLFIPSLLLLGAGWRIRLIWFIARPPGLIKQTFNIDMPRFYAFPGVLRNVGVIAFSIDL